MAKALRDLFCENAKRRRLELGLTQEEVASRLGVGQPAYAHIEAGRRSPGIAIIESVAEALNCDPLDLLKPAKNGRGR